MLNGVQINEYDNSQIIRNYTNEIGGFVGMFEKGKINVPTFITSATEFKTIFGRGLDIFCNDWYQVYNYLQYSSGIWVVRCAGDETYNAMSYSDDFEYNPIQVQTVDEFYGRWNTLQTENGVVFCANTAGESGNLISVHIINKDDYKNNILVFGNYAKNIFDYFNDGYVGIVIARNNIIVEKYYISQNTLNSNTSNKKTIPFTSQYVYAKFNEFDVDVNNGVYELSGGITQIPNTSDWDKSHELLHSVEDYVIDNFIINQDALYQGYNVGLSRQDCLCYLGLPVSQQDILCFDEDPDVGLDGKSTKIQIWNTESDDIIVEDSENLKSDYTLERVKEFVQLLNYGDFLVVINNIKEQKDGFTNKTKLINIAGDIAGLKAQASLKTPYTPNAGLVNGEIKNLVKSHIEWSKSEMAEMYDMGLNYINNGYLMSQKTYTNVNSAFNRINVRSLFNHLERTISAAQRESVFEFNDSYTLNKAKTQITKILEDAKSARGLQNYKIVTHSVTTGDVIDPNTIVIEIYIQPTYVAEQIILNVYNDGTTDIR